MPTASTRRVRFLLAAFLALAACRFAGAQESLLPRSVGGDSEQDFVKASGYFTLRGGTQEGTLYVTAEMAPGWHIYSITQAPGGPLKTKIKLTPSPAYKLTGEFKALEAPKVHQYQDVWPGVKVEEHE